MLEAKKCKWFEKIFAVYNKNLLNRRFHSFRACGLKNLPVNFFDVPKIIYANHSCWWDGLVAFQLSQMLGLDAFVMMEEKHLKSHLPFQRLGAFSIDREKPFEAIKSINYAAALLREKPQRTLWIFPQGRILPNNLRPIQFYGGISKIIKKAGKCFAVPAGFKYEFSGSYKPEIFVKFGAPEIAEAADNISSKFLTKTFANRLALILEELNADILTNNLNDFENVI